MQKKLCTKNSAKKFYTPENMQKNFAPLKICKKPTQLPKLQQNPYKTLQKSKAEKFPGYPLTNPKKPLKFPYKINTFQRLAINNPHQIVNKNKGPKKLGKNHLWTNSFTPWNFSPVFSANGS